jgi:hypothetical protein
MFSIRLLATCHCVFFILEDREVSYMFLSLLSLTMLKFITLHLISNLLWPHFGHPI